MSLYYLVKRNMLLYFKDRAAVFFSLLSVFIVIMLMVVFLGDMNKNALLEAIQTTRGGTLLPDDADNAQRVILLWTMAGMLAVNSFTVPTTMIGIFVEDKQRNKIESFFTAPISRTKLLGGYVIAAILTGMIMCCITLLLSYGYMLSQGYAFLSFLEVLQVLGLLLVSVSVSSCIILLISQFIYTSNAWGSFSTVAGTLIGFLGGIYLPMGALPEVVQSVLKGLPFLHEAGMLRSVFTNQAITDAFQGLPAEAISAYQGAMGIKIELFNETLQLPIQVAVLVLCGIITLSIAVYKLRKHTSFDR